MKITKLLLPFLFLMSGCAEEVPEIKNEGEITLSSEFVGSDNYYFRLGYSFEKAKFFKIPSINENEIPDVFLEDITLPGSEDMVAFIYSESGNDNGIFKNGDFKNLNEAESFYNEYIVAISGPWDALSDSIKKFQVYTFKTSVNNYVKLLVLDLRMFKNVTVPDYMEVDLKYFIQRDGSQSFFPE